MTDVELVSKAISNARASGKMDLVRRINHDINVEMIPFEEIVAKYDLR